MSHANVAFFIPHLGCPHLCSFCDQRSISGAVSPPAPEEVGAQAAAALARLDAAQKRNTEIAFFGGSFTALPRPLMQAYLSAVTELVGENGFAGVRLSTRPDAVDPSILNLLKRYGVTAVELGAQSMDDRVLACNRRGHTAADTVRAARMVRQAGLELGLQMMVGLPGEPEDGAQQTACAVARLCPDTVRVYPTVVVEGTLLADWFRAGKYTPLTVERAVEICAPLLPFFEERGIRVIRMGLHAEKSLETRLLAGAYHPAFRELCESRLYLMHLLKLLDGRPAGEYTIAVPARRLSQAIGQGGRNRQALLARGWRVKFVGRQGRTYEAEIVRAAGV